MALPKAFRLSRRLGLSGEAAEIAPFARSHGVMGVDLVSLERGETASSWALCPAGEH